MGANRRFPKGDRKALWSPPQRRNPPQSRKSEEGFSLAFHKKSVSCGRFRPPAGGRGTFPHGKVPKGCRGRPKGACLMAAPGPPVAKQQCTASLAGARPAGLTAYLGGPLSPSAQSIPPPAFGHRFIPGVSARDHYGRNTLPQYVPRHQGHAQCVPTPAPDWLLAPGQTKWRVRYGPCRSRNKGKYPFRHKEGTRVSLGRLKGV